MHKLLYLTLILSLVWSISPNLHAWNHDLELWTWEKLEIDLAHVGIPGGHSFYFENATRFDDDISHFLMDHQMVGIHFDLPWFEGWSVLPSYRYIDVRSKAIENRYLVDLFYKKKQIFDSSFDAKFRFRWEARDIRDRDDITYRFRPSVTFYHPTPFSIKDRPITAYLMNEVNFDFRNNKFHRHRVGTGFKFPFSSNINWTLGYQLETNRIRSGSWSSDSQIMTGFHFTF